MRSTTTTLKLLPNFHMLETETENIINDAVLDDEQEEGEVETYAVQWGMKWVNFTAQVEARNENEAVELAWKSYEENGLQDFTVTARNRTVDSLEDIFESIKFHPQVNLAE
jgi:hypothetical protein